MQLLARYQQHLKWTVYLVLTLNCVFYLFDDMRIAASTMPANPTFLDYTSAYNTTIDDFAWLTLLFLFEGETYWMEDEGNEILYGFMNLLRLGCYVILGHTLYAYVIDQINYYASVPIEGVTDYCALLGQDLSFTRNYEYWVLDANNCTSFGDGGAIYKLVNEPVVTDMAGYLTTLNHAWASTIETVGWLLISFILLFTVLVQNRGIYDSPLITWANRSQVVVYTSIVGCAIYWSFNSHFMYTFDTLLWIGGFMAIDANLSDWRDELAEDAAA